MNTPNPIVRIISTGLFCLIATGIVHSSHAAPKAKRKRGVDPKTLALNTSQEPDLKQSGMVDLFNGQDGFNAKLKVPIVVGPAASMAKRWVVGNIRSPRKRNMHGREVR